MLPWLLTYISTITLDVLNHKEAIKISPGATVAVIDTAEERQRREKIPKRATIINTSLFIFAASLSIIVTIQSNWEPEEKNFTMTISSAIVNALRNPIIACWAFQVNRQIRQETVDDRRNKEIQEALKKRAERKNKIRPNDQGSLELDDIEGLPNSDTEAPKIEFERLNGHDKENHDGPYRTCTSFRPSSSMESSWIVVQQRKSNPKMKTAGMALQIALAA